MKKLMFVAFLACAGLSVNAQEASNTVKQEAAAPYKFKETTHEFGKVPQGVPATYTFEFQNISNQPLVIESAQASCGCTTPEYPKEPILPSKDAKIKVSYNAATVGPFSKSITIKFASIQQPLILFIKGEVQAKATTASL
jgi:curli biogenesis system outer membrane secretion channel CsgG